MAVAIELECASVIVPIRALEERYAGGLAAYRDDCPNNSYLQDDHLTRVGFMSTHEAGKYLEKVAAKGLRVTGGPGTGDALILCSGGEPVPPCGIIWSTFCDPDGCGTPRRTTGACVYSPLV